MEFLVSGVYGRKDLYAFQRAVRARSRNGYQTFFRWWGAVMGAWMLYAGARAVAASVSEGATAVLWVSTILPMGLLTLIGVYLLTAGITDRSFLNEWKTWLNYAYKRQTITYRFGEKRFEEILNGSELRFAYATIGSLYEDGKRFYLFINGQNAHLIRKADFQQGEPDAFRAFIEAKTGLHFLKTK